MKTMRSKIMTCMMLAVMFVMALGMGSWATGDIWSTKANMPTAKSHLAAVSFNGKIYTVGGYAGGYATASVEEYDIATNTWTTKASMSNARTSFGLALVNNKIYAIGGFNGSICLDTVEEYDPSTNTWTQVASMPVTSGNCAAASVNNKIYVVTAGSTSNKVYEYNPTANSWTSKNQNLTPRNNFAISSLNNKIYIMGGIYNFTASTIVEEYVPATDSVTTKAAWSAAKTQISAGALKNKIYAVGGSPYQTDLQEYNPSLDVWIARTSMQYGRASLGVATTNDYLYAFGGEGDQSVAKNYTEQYTPPISISDAPTNLTAQVNGTQVDLSWTGSTGATSYNVKRSSTTGGSYTTLANVTGTTYTDTTVTSGNTYYYVVTAVNEAGESGNSNEAVANLAVAAPVLSGTWSSGKVNLSWTSANGATGYNVRKALASGGPYTIIANNITSTSYEDINVANGNTYYYVVNAIGAAGEGPNSNEVCMTLVGNRAILEITMTNGKIKEYDLTISQIDAFINWYDNRANGTGKTYYTIRKTSNIKPFLGRRDYIIFDKILDFEVKDYNDEE